MLGISGMKKMLQRFVFNVTACCIFLCTSANLMRQENETIDNALIPFCKDHGHV